MHFCIYLKHNSSETCIFENENYFKQEVETKMKHLMPNKLCVSHMVFEVMKENGFHTVYTQH
jgi:thiamine phosphate synthase YjbQ (UPF0047 family)